MCCRVWILYSFHYCYKDFNLHDVLPDNYMASERYPEGRLFIMLIPFETDQFGKGNKSYSRRGWVGEALLGKQPMTFFFNNVGNKNNSSDNQGDHFSKIIFPGSDQNSS